MTGPQPTGEIINWAKSQPPWRQDALRRILTRPFTRSDEDECLVLLKKEHGYSSPMTAEPLEAKHLPLHSSSATTLRLLQIDQIANVNRLAADAVLAFAANGITIIYGDNGSGKSGFIRILKKVCRARDNEKILPDVFAKKATASAAEARFSFQEGTTAKPPIMWRNDGKSSSDLLGRFAIFDSRCASVHVDGENRIEVVPYNLDCFEKLAQVCDALKARLKSEYDAFEGRLSGALPDVPENTTAHAFLAELSQKTQTDIESACSWEAAQEKRLHQLGGILQDPAAEAARLTRLAASLTEFADGLTSSALALSDEKVADIKTGRGSATHARAAASASAAAIFASEPLPGAGEDAWRMMFDAARTYSETHAYPGHEFPLLEADSRCVLCQQALDDASRDRFKRFADFVSGAMSATAKSLEDARDAAIRAISPPALVIPQLPQEALDYLTKQLPGLAKQVPAFSEALKRRQAAIINNEEVAALPDSPDVLLREEIASLTASARDASNLASADLEAAHKPRQEFSELLGRKALQAGKSELSRRIGIYAELRSLDKCMKACTTKSISDQGSKLLKAHVTDALAHAIENELKLLGVQNIPLVLSDRTSKAVVQHRLKLDGATLAADTSAVLSEGEHRAVALAVFLAELKMYESLDGIIIDDPVSSLDHQRRSKVAWRLANEANLRQVIVFTHDLVFVSEVSFYAAKEQVSLKISGIYCGPKGFGTLDPDGPPWLTRDLGNRRQWLERQLASLKKLYVESSEAYEKELRFFYARLRESWEKLIEEKVFAQVIGRFQPQVQTLRLRAAVIDDDIYSRIHFGMSAVSSFTGHDKAGAKGGGLADPAECEKDLREFVGCLEEVREKSKNVAKARDLRVDPPAH